jgi:hypothetical protein
MTRTMYTMRTHKEPIGRYGYTITRVEIMAEQQPSGRYTVDTPIATVGGYSSRSKATTAGRRELRHWRTFSGQRL